MLNRIKSIIKRLHIRDLFAPFIFLLLLVPSWIFKIANKLRHKCLWLVAEEGEARDNGYSFYKYVRENHPDDYCFYAIKPSSAGCQKVAKLGNIIKFGSLKHWLYYMSADLNISSQPGGNPRAFFWYFMHGTLGLYRNRVFLQHGITKDDAPPLHYQKAKYKYFICGAKPEYDEISRSFGYPDGAVLFTGFPRWDDFIIQDKKSPRTILVMPTWRKYLEVQNSTLFDKNDFTNTAFFKAWNGLLNNADLIEFIEKNEIKIYFYPHQNIQKKLHLFRSKSDNIQIVSMRKDITKYLSQCSLLVTDYSSVFFDFAFLDKPVIYYQFDQAEFRKKHHKEGYFNYERDGFGDVVEDEDNVIKKIKYHVNSNFVLEKKYAERVNGFFLLRDKKNSERVYEAIK